MEKVGRGGGQLVKPILSNSFVPRILIGSDDIYQILSPVCGICDFNGAMNLLIIIFIVQLSGVVSEYSQTHYCKGWSPIIS